MNKFRGKEAGGTLAGFIAGLVVGLGIAVVVAITINKTPVPFMNKSVKADKPNEAASAPMGDPNQPLYGSKEAARDAARDFMKEPSPNPTVEEAKLPAATTPAAGKAAPDAKAGDAKPADAKAADAAAEDKWTYYLQAGAFKDQPDAEAAKAKLALEGFEASIQERPSDTGTLYRVRLGPYNQLDAMNKVRSKLSESGVDVSVVRVAK